MSFIFIAILFFVFGVICSKYININKNDSVTLSYKELLDDLKNKLSFPEDIYKKQHKKSKVDKQTEEELIRMSDLNAVLDIKGDVDTVFIRDKNEQQKEKKFIELTKEEMEIIKKRRNMTSDLKSKK